MPGASEGAFASAHVLCNVDDKVEFYAHATSYEVGRAVSADRGPHLTNIVARGPLAGAVHLRFGLIPAMMQHVYDLSMMASQFVLNKVKLTYSAADGSPIGVIEFQGHISSIRLVTGADGGDSVELQFMMLSDPETGGLHLSVQT